MNIIFKIVMFGIFINFGIGITLLLIPSYTSTCFVYNSQTAKTFNQTMGGVVNPNNNLQDQTSSFVRLIDSLNLGVIGKFLGGLNTFLFGVLEYAKCLLGYASMSNADKFTYNVVDGMLRFMIGIGYILGSIYLWTGRIINR